MPTQKLEIDINSKVSDGVAGIIKVTDSLEKLDKEASGSLTKSLANIEKLLTQISRTSYTSSLALTSNFQKIPKAVSATEESFKKVDKSSRGAGSSMAALNNIVRDAPYGINGVANNITQLADSLFGATIAAQAASFGISLLVTAAVSLSQKYGSLSNAIDELFGNLTAAEKAQRGLLRAQEEGAVNAQKELVSVDALYRASQNLQLSLEERKRVVDELQKQYPQTFANLTDEAILAGKAATAYENLRNQIVAKAQFEALGKILVEEGEKFASFSKKIRETEKRIAELRKTDSRLSDLSVLNDADVANESVKQAIQANLQLLTTYRKEQQKITDEQKILADEQQRFIQDAGTFVLDLNPDKTGKSVKTIANVLQDLRTELNAVDQQSKKVGLTFDELNKGILTPLEKAFDDIAKIGGAGAEKALKTIGDEIKKVKSEFIGGEKIDTKQLLTFTKGGKIDVGQNEISTALLNVEQNAQKFRDNMGKLGKEAQENFRKNFVVLGDALNGAISPVIIELEGLLRSALSNIAVSIGESIGNIVTGAKGLTDVFNGLLKVIGDFIKQFGQALIVAATTRIIAEKALVANPYVALAAGIAAVAAGQALQNIVPSFATGGAVIGAPTLAMVGDNPGREEYIIPSEVLDKMDGSGWGMPDRIELYLNGQNASRVVYRGQQYAQRANGGR